MLPTTYSTFNSIKLKSFENFKDTNEALVAATAIVESKLDKKLKKFLKKQLQEKESKLAVCDKNLGAAIKSKLGIQCVCDDSVVALMRGIRNNLTSLLGDVTTEKDLQSMSLGLSHSLS